VQSTSRSPSKVAADSGVFAHSRLAKLLRLVFDTAALRGQCQDAPPFRFRFEQNLFGGRAGGMIIARTAMRILAIDHGTVRMGIAISDESKLIAQPLEQIPAEPFADFLARLEELLRDKEVELILVGMPRNMNGSYGPAALKVQDFVAALRGAVIVPIKTWDERLTSAQANRFLLEGDVSRTKRKEKVDKMAAAILLQSYLDSAPI
jgi:putative Holliday junction resolvase